LYIGSNKAGALYLGANEVDRAYYGNTIIWPMGAYPLGPVSTLAWWRADDPDMMTLSGGKVTQWFDQINGYAMVQGTDARRPVFSATSFNGSPGITFSSSAQTWLEMASSPWPVNDAQSMVFVVCDQLTPASTATVKTIFAYGNTAFTQRKVQRLVRGGANRAAADVGNTFSTYPIYEGTQNFSGRQAVTAFFGDANSTVALGKEFAGVNSLAMRTSAGRTRIGADALAVPTEFCDCIIRDVVVVDSFYIQPGEFDAFITWAIARTEG
jgi:hypothetical protein